MLCSLSAAFLTIRFAVRLANTPAMKAIASRVGDVADMSRDQCLSLEESSEVRTCVFGNLNSPNNLLLFGDSHARQWFNPLRRIATSKGWKLTTLVRADCPATEIRPPDLTRALADKCMAWRTEALERIVAMRPNLVFVGNATCYLRHGGKDTTRSVSLDEWRDGTRRTLKTLSDAGLEVVAVRDNPIPPFDVLTCLQRAGRNSWYSNSSCSIERSAALDPAVFKTEETAASGIANIHFIDLTSHFCQGDVCPAVQQGMIVYRDDNHLTGKYAESLTPCCKMNSCPSSSPEIFEEV